MSQIETGQLPLEVGTTSLFMNKTTSAIMGKKGKTDANKPTSPFIFFTLNVKRYRFFLKA